MRLLLREWTFRAALLLVSVSVGLLLAEGITRLLSARLFSMDSLSHRFDPELGWVQRTGLTMVRRNEAGTRVAVAGDPMGIRRPTTAYRRDARNILAVGDSFTAGTQVPFEDTWSWRLQELLKQSGLEFQVVNAGVDGYDLSQSYRLARRLWSTFRPRHVVLALYVGNDLVDYERESDARPPWEGSGPLVWAREHSYLYHLARGVFRRHDRPPAALPEESPGVVRSVPGFERLGPVQQLALRRQFASPELLPVLKGTEEGLRSLRASERLVAAMKDLAREHGAGFTLVLVPTKQQAIPEQREEWMALHQLTEAQALSAQRRLREWANGIGTVVVDPLDLMAAAPDPRRLYWVANMHMTPAGHELLARALAPVLARQLREAARGGAGGPEWR
jgi:lysophospholipase L1-like esterase